MLSFLSGLLQGILGFLSQFLPDSPIQGWLAGAEGLGTGLAWLNWVVPIGDMIGIFAAWLALLGVWIIVRMALGKATGIAGDLIS